MRGKQVYLAGPISGCRYGECVDWRENYIKALNPFGITCWSPMRDKSYLDSVGEINGEYDFDPLATARGIMTRDFNDCTRCDLLLVNLLYAKRISIGTVMELAWAFQARIPAVVVMEEGNIHAHPMVHEAIGFRVESHSAAIEIIKSILV